MTVPRTPPLLLQALVNFYSVWSGLGMQCTPSSPSPLFFGLRFFLVWRVVDCLKDERLPQPDCAVEKVIAEHLPGEPCFFLFVFVVMCVAR